jgi:hypothetical protein
MFNRFHSLLDTGKAHELCTDFDHIVATATELDATTAVRTMAQSHHIPCAEVTVPFSVNDGSIIDDIVN